jgi:hypothetical protein
MLTHKGFFMHVVMQRLEQYGQVLPRGNRVRIAIPSICRHDRMAVLQAIHRDFQDFGACYLTDRPDYSSIGYVKIQNLKICVKSQQQQQKRSPGVPNEQVLIQKINKYLEQHGTLNLIFLSDAIAVRYLDVVRCTATENRKLRNGRNKADMILETTSSTHAISIKQSDAERWESADTARGKIAREKLQTALDQAKTQLIPALTDTGYPIYRSGDRSKPVMRVEPEIYWRMSVEEQRDAMFGDDVRENGAVVVNTFADQHFECDDVTKTMKVVCNKIYTPDTTNVDNSYWMIRNDVTRNCIPLGVAGLRIESVFESRIKYGVEVQ